MNIVRKKITDGQIASLDIELTKIDTNSLCILQGKDAIHIKETKIVELAMFLLENYERAFYDARLRLKIKNPG